MSHTISATVGITAPQKPGFAYSVNLNDTQNLGTTVDQELVTDIDAALNDWGQYICGTGTVVVQLNVTPTTRENGGPTSVEPVGPDGSRELYTPSSLYELTTGQHVAGTTSDITVNVDPTFLMQDVWLNPDPGSPDALPDDLLDQVSIFRHEIGHGLGIIGFTDTSGTLGPDELPWDTYLEKDSSTARISLAPTRKRSTAGRSPSPRSPTGRLTPISPTASSTRSGRT